MNDFSSELSMTYSQEAQVTLESGPEVLFLRQYVKRVPFLKFLSEFIHLYFSPTVISTTKMTQVVDKFF